MTIEHSILTEADSDWLPVNDHENLNFLDDSGSSLVDSESENVNLVEHYPEEDVNLAEYLEPEHEADSDLMEDVNLAQNSKLNPLVFF